MPIPDEVIAAADRAGFEAPLEPALYEYQVVAEWARKEAAADLLNLIQGPPMDEYDRAIADAIRALTEAD